MGCGDRGYIGRKPRSNVAVRFAVASVHPRRLQYHVVEPGFIWPRLVPRHHLSIVTNFNIIIINISFICTSTSES